MNDSRSIDGVLVQWGDRLFYPGNRRTPAAPGLSPTRAGIRDRAAVIRRRIESAVRRAPQVMVKVTGGGRGMAAIAAHLRYISKNGRLPMEDDRGNQREGKEAMHDVAEQWRLGGSRIPEKSDRREAFNIMLSMPRGTDPLLVQWAAREFAQAELAGHRYVMVLHDHQANPHVHLSVRAESRQGKRLNPRKADLQRWRETFVEKLRGWGIEAEATRQATRGEQRRYPTLWRAKAQAQGRLREPATTKKSGERFLNSHKQALEAWVRIMAALTASNEPADRKLAGCGEAAHQQDAVRDRLRAEPEDRSTARTTRDAAGEHYEGQPFANRAGDRTIAQKCEQPVLAAGRARGQAAQEPPARARERVGSPRRVKGSLAPGCARP